MILRYAVATLPALIVHSQAKEVETVSSFLVMPSSDSFAGLFAQLLCLLLMTRQGKKYPHHNNYCGLEYTNKLCCRKHPHTSFSYTQFLTQTAGGVCIKFLTCLKCYANSSLLTTEMNMAVSK